MSQPALIVGAGIGGMCAALSLARAGLAVELFEQAAELGEIGAGIQLSPNAVRVLHELGLEQALAQVGFRPTCTELRTWRFGVTVGRKPLGEQVLATFGYPYYHIHRADLLGLLLTALRAETNIRVHLNARCASFTQSEERVEITCADGSSHSGAFVVGADGIRSVVREELFGKQSPRFTGNVAWRSTVPISSLPKDLIRPVGSVWMGPDRHFVHYYVRGGELVNFVALVGKSGWEVESWTEKGEKSELRADFAGWHSTIQHLIEATDPEQCYKWALFDREPLSQWTRGRVTLLGDSCHATLPFMAQGACMAIEDAAVLARCVSTVTPLPTALLAYENMRKQRTAKIQIGSRTNGQQFHLSSLAAWKRNLTMLTQKKGPHLINDWLFGYNALTEPIPTGD